MHTKSIRTKGKDFATSFSGDRFRMAPAQTDHIDKLFDHLVELSKNNLSIVASAEWLVTIANDFILAILRTSRVYCLPSPAFFL